MLLSLLSVCVCVFHTKSRDLEKAWENPVLCFIWQKKPSKHKHSRILPFLDSLRNPPCTLFRRRITPYIPLSYAKNQYPTAAPFFSTPDHEDYSKDSCAGETCQDWQLRSQELCFCTEQVCGQAAGVKSPFHLLISVFLAPFPCTASFWIGKESCFGRKLSFSGCSFCQRRLACSQSCKHLTIAKSS